MSGSGPLPVLASFNGQDTLVLAGSEGDAGSSPAAGTSRTEHVAAVASSRAAADGLAAHLEAAGWRRAGEAEPVGSIWFVPMERGRLGA